MRRVLVRLPQLDLKSRHATIGPYAMPLARFGHIDRGDGRLLIDSFQ
jgi:hypothetical protein